MNPSSCFEALHGTESVKDGGKQTAERHSESLRELVLGARQTGANKVSVPHTIADLPALIALSRGS